MFDPLSEGALRDPFQLYDRLRVETPVYFDERLQAWIITRHRDAARVLSEHQTFGTDIRKAGVEIPDSSNSIQLLDPPEHGTINRVLVRGCRAQDWQQLRGSLLKEISYRLNVAAGHHSADFCKEVAAPVAFHAITTFLGLRDAELDAVHEWSTAIVNAMDSGLNPSAAAPGAAARDQLTELVTQEYHSDRSEGLIGWMRQHSSGVAPTSTITNTLRAMLHAGYAPVAKLLANALHAVLASSSACLTQLQICDHERWSGELLRYATPVHAVCRVTNTESEIGGYRIHPNQEVVVLLAAANRDPEVFPDPHLLLLQRDTTAALAFGCGPHYCPGASLATLVLVSCLGLIATRFARTRLIGDPEPLPNAVLRGPAHMMVHLIPES